MGAKKWGKGANTKVHLICIKIGGKYNFGVLISKIDLIFENFDVQRVKLEKMGAKKWGKGAYTKVHLICMKNGGKYNFGVLILKLELIFENSYI